MKFAITASDRYLGVWQAFVAQGWQPLKLFISPTENPLFPNRAVLEHARQHGIDVQASPLRQRDLDDLAQRECEALIVASYNRRIGDWRPYLRYAVNFHPSPLPIGRGPYPLVPAILGGHRAWGVSCHRLEAAFDSGPLLASQRFPLAPDECHESLGLKVQLAAQRLAAVVAGDFERLWQAATPQGEGNSVPLWTDADRTLDFDQGVADLMRRIRAFGLLECLATINGVTVHVRRAVAWEQTHDHQPGSLVHSSAMQMVVAARDGFVGIIEWHLHAPQAAIGTPAR